MEQRIPQTYSFAGQQQYVPQPYAQYGRQYPPQYDRRAAQPAHGGPSRTDILRSAYSRAGFSCGALYGAMSAAESIALMLIITVFVAALGGGNNRIPLTTDYGESISRAVQLIKESGMLLPAVLLFVFCVAGGMSLGMILMRKIVKKGSPIDRRSLSFGKFMLVALICFGLWGVGALLGNAAALCGAPQSDPMSGELLGKSIIPYLVYAMIGAPFFEELAFRKTLLDRLHDHGEGFAAAVSALLFGLIHGNHMQFFLAFFIGLVFAMVYQRTGRVIYTMLLHSMINTFATVPEILGLYGIDIELPWMIAAGALTVGGLVTLILMRKDPLLRAAPCKVPDANRAAYQNAGMRFARIAGLVLVGAQGVILIFMPLMNDGNRLHLIGLIPLALVFVTVLLLPRFTKRFEAKAEVSAPAAPEARS